MDFLASIMKDLNSNLVAGKVSLEEMRDGNNRFKMRDGSEIEVPIDQIDRIWEICDDHERIRLKLPFYVNTETTTETPAWKVEGIVEASVVAKLLGKRLQRDGYLRLYHSDLGILKKIVPECYIIVFAS